MIKKIFLALVLVIGLQFMAEGSLLYAPASYAGNSEGAIESTGFMFDLSAITHEGIEGTTRQSWIRRGINYFFERIIGVMAAVIGSLAVLMMSVGGFLMLSAAGDQTRFEKGVNYFKYSLIGLGVTLLAYVMVTLVQLLITSIYA